MRKALWVFLFAVIATTSFLAPAAHADSAGDVRDGLAALRLNDFTGAERKLDAAIKAGDLRGEQLAMAYFLRGLARWNMDRREEAAQDMTDGLKHAAHGQELWVDIADARMYIFFELERWRDCALDFVALAKARFTHVKEIEFKFVSRLIWSLEDADEGMAFEVLRTVKTIGYAPKDPDDSLDWLMGLYARLLTQRGETQAAISELAAIGRADPLVDARIDRRYAPLWSHPAFEAATKPSDLGPRELANAARRLASAPNHTGLITQLVVAQRQAGEAEKAVATARAALQNESALKSSDDGALLWLRNELVYALGDLGSEQEMFAVMEPILKLDPAKDGNVVNQLINFAEIMLEFDRPREAVETARRAWDASSPFGKMFVQMVEVCATATTDKTRAGATLAAMLKTAEENDSALTIAYLCMDRQDDAATLVKQRLAAPGKRAQVLRVAQIYRKPAFETPFRKRIMERHRAVMDRPDIRKEIEKYGRVETFPLVSIYWGSL